MKLIYNTSNFTEEGEYFVSAPFQVESTDSLITIQAELSENGIITVQSSLDEVDWFDIPNTTITCSPKGLESYTECQKDISYRLKSSEEVVTAVILI